MALTKISTGMLKQDAASSDLNIDAGTLYLDVSNNRVGIATTSPGTPLDVQSNSSAEGIRVRGRSSDSIGQITLTNNGGTARSQLQWNDSFFNIKALAAIPMIFYTNGTERMRIQSSGSVGIGTTTPSEKLQVNGNIALYGELKLVHAIRHANSGAQVIDNDNDTYFIINDPEGSNRIKIGDSGDASNTYRNTTHKFEPASGTEYMRIDSSGNLLVGKTSASYSTAGQEFRANGATILGRDGAEPLNLNRLNSDGGILNFRKDNTTVGSIGTAAGNLYIVSNDVGLNFAGGGDGIYPATANGAQRDAAIDLGHSTHRFKDVWVSNGIQGSSTMYWSLPHTSGGALRLEFGNYNNTARRTVQFYKDNVEPLAAYTDLISLGQSTNRFKDLHLSGTANIVGTAGRGLVISNATES